MTGTGWSWAVFCTAVSAVALANACMWYRRKAGSSVQTEGEPQAGVEEKKEREDMNLSAMQGKLRWMRRSERIMLAGLVLVGLGFFTRLAAGHWAAALENAAWLLIGIMYYTQVRFTKDLAQTLLAVTGIVRCYEKLAKLYQEKDHNSSERIKALKHMVENLEQQNDLRQQVIDMLEGRDAEPGKGQKQ